MLHEGQEIFTLDAEGMINKAVKVGLSGDREMSLEDYAIMAGKNGDDGRGELDEERVRRVHGVLLQKGASAIPFWTQNASCALTALVAATAALGRRDGHDMCAGWALASPPPA